MAVTTFLLEGAGRNAYYDESKSLYYLGSDLPTSNTKPKEEDKSCLCSNYLWK